MKAPLIELVREAAPEPWLAWLLAALVRQVACQRWLARTVAERLGDERAGNGAPSGEIPGMPGYRYNFHGIGCCITKPTGEIIDFDFHDEEGLTIDPHFFAWRIEKLPDPQLVERRVRELLSSTALLVHAVGLLRNRGVLWQPGSVDAFRIPKTLEAFATEHASTLADAEWQALDEGSHDYVEFLRAAAHDIPEAIELLVPRVSTGELVAIVRDALDGPITPRTGKLVETIGDIEALRAIEHVSSLLERLDPQRDAPYPAFATVRYLLRRDIETTDAVAVLVRFARVDVSPGFRGNPFVGDFAVLALEHPSARPYALELVRRALRSNTPMSRNTVCAALVLLDHSWCADEIALALDTKRGWAETAEHRSALGRLTHPAARKIAEAWLRAHGPPPHEDGFLYSGDEVAEVMRDELLESELKALGDRLRAVRDELRDLPMRHPLSGA